MAHGITLTGSQKQFWIISLRLNVNSEEIKVIRNKSGLNQSDLARLLGVNQSQISRWEKGIQSLPLWAENLFQCLINPTTIIVDMTPLTTFFFCVKYRLCGSAVESL